MYFEQIYLSCLAQASYLIGDEEAGVAVVVDPRRDVDVYLEKAREHGFVIEHVLLTHFHADFLSGHLELRARVGATIHIGAAGRTEYPSVPMREGHPLVLGKTRLEFLATPGHTPESTSIVVYDRPASAAKPYAVLTGDTLFVGDVGRPDLMASVGVTQEELASQLYRSLHEKLLRLPDETLVYPAHGAGSLCGKALGSENHTTIGAQRELNYALQPMSEAEFVALVSADQPLAPPYFAYDAELNRSEHPTLDEELKKGLRPLALDDVLRRLNAGEQLVDVRDPDVYCRSHVAGAINVGLDGKFATWCGFVLERERPIVVIATPGQEREAVLRLGRIGYDFVVGYLDGGMDAVATRPDLLETNARVDPEQLEALLAGDDAPYLIDVRGPDEWDAGRIAGAVHMPLQTLRDHLDDVPADRPLALYCAAGYRSSIAVSLLKRRGITDTVDLVGGIGAWSKRSGVAV